MKKRSLNFTLYTLALFSLFFSEKVFASEYPVSVGNTFVCPTLSGNTAYSVQPFSSSPPFEGESIISTIAYSGITCDGSTVYSLQAAMVAQPSADYYLIYGQASGNTWDGVSGTIYYGYFNWDGTNVISSLQASTTRIVSQNTPANSSTITTFVANINYDYFATGAGGYDKAGYELRDVTTGYQYNTLENTINSSGISTFSTSTAVTAYHMHMWRPYLRNSTTDTRINGVWYNFEVISASASSTPLLSGEGFSTTTTGFLQFLNVPELLKTRLPFAYFFQFVDVMEDLDQYSSSTIPIGSFSWKWASGTPAESTITVDLFSTSTIQTYLTPTLTSLLRNLMVAVTYFSTMWFLFHEAKRKHLFT